MDGLGVKKRYNLSSELERRIKEVLTLRDACSGRAYTKSELVIDHKFPSQRWITGETKNFEGMTDDEIRAKFQLLTDQNNLLKAKDCDRCVDKGKRGKFFGLEWYYAGDENWQGAASEEKGCIGCPWYDTRLWKALCNTRLTTP